MPAFAVVIVIVKRHNECAREGENGRERERENKHKKTSRQLCRYLLNEPPTPSLMRCEICLAASVPALQDLRGLREGFDANHVRIDALMFDWE